MAVQLQIIIDARATTIHYENGGKKLLHELPLASAGVVAKEVEIFMEIHLLHPFTPPLKDLNLFSDGWRSRCSSLEL